MNTPNPFYQSFQNILNTLNTAQKKAVEKTEGPLMVIAGPGTGKTQILSARIGYILLETDTQPENILCLTYTDAGAMNMRKRLLKFIGPTAYKINILTFHALCNEIIQNNLSLFEITNLDPISEIESVQLFKQLIDNLPKENILKRKRGDIYFDIKGLKQLFSIIKKENLSIDFIQEKITEYINKIPENPDFTYKRKYKQFNAGDLKQGLVDDEVEKMNKLYAAVSEFNNMELLMKKNNSYDFEDMINWVVNEFTQNANFLLKYQEQYQYILVDEYQDTSGSQNKLIELLANYWQEPNLFVVGDDDQSIYRFQGANIENLKNFVEKYITNPNEEIVVLTENYRSTQTILNTAQKLIKYNSERLTNNFDFINKNLQAANKNLLEINIPISIIEYKNPAEEMMDICLQIEELIFQKKINPAEIAVLYKENKFGENLIKYLQHKNIPYYCSKSIHLLNEQIIQQILTILKYIELEMETPNFNEHILFEILHYNWFNISPTQLIKFYVKHKKTNSLRMAIYNASLKEAGYLFVDNDIENIIKANDILEDLIKQKNNLSLIHLIENVLNKTGIIAYLLNIKDNFILLKKVTAFFDLVKTELHRKPAMKLKQFLELIETIQAEGLSIPFNESVGRETGVQLLTVHSAKGLEFQYVFLMGLDEKFWNNKRGISNHFNLPNTIFNEATKQAQIEETRRLFFVAITRAAKFLQISYPANNEKSKPVQHALYIAEICNDLNSEIIKKDLNQETILPFLVLNISTEKKPNIEIMEADFIDPLLEKFVLNVTALNNYLDCPLKFYYQNLIKVPAAKSESLAFGTAVHYALQKYFEDMIANNNQFLDVSTLIEYFINNINRNKEIFTEKTLNRTLERGQEILYLYNQEYINKWNKIVSIEKNMPIVLSNGIPLKGKLDKIEFDGNNVLIIDYKTGDFNNATEKLKAPNEKNNMLGGDYWRQAVFYKILIDNYQPKNWKVLGSVFDFVEPDKKGIFKKEVIPINNDDVEIVMKLISHVWEQIQQKNFYTGCGKATCNWCNFAKNMNTTTYSDLEE